MEQGRKAADDFGNSALVLFSGGQDSATCLAWALAEFGRVETVGFNYGQRHSVELEQRPVHYTNNFRRSQHCGSCPTVAAAAAAAAEHASAARANSAAARRRC